MLVSRDKKHHHKTSKHHDNQENRFNMFQLVSKGKDIDHFVQPHRAVHRRQALPRVEMGNALEPNHLSSVL